MVRVRRTVVPGAVDAAGVRVVESGHADRYVARAPFSWVQILGLVLGAVFIVLGAVALARTGLPGSDWTQPHIGVAGLDHTPLLAILEIVFGLLLIVAGATRSRSGLIFLGGVALIFGIITLIEPTPFHDVLGIHVPHSWLFITTGALSLIAAILAPTVYGTDRIVVSAREDVVRDERLAVPSAVVEERAYEPTSPPYVEGEASPPRY